MVEDIGLILWDFNNLTMPFEHNKRFVTLKGINFS